jgi:hypothetical protein
LDWVSVLELASVLASASEWVLEVSESGLVPAGPGLPVRIAMSLC